MWVVPFAGVPRNARMQHILVYPQLDLLPGSLCITRKFLCLDVVLVVIGFGRLWQFGPPPLAGMETIPTSWDIRPGNIPST